MWRKPSPLARNLLIPLKNLLPEARRTIVHETKRWSTSVRITNTEPSRGIFSLRSDIKSCFLLGNQKQRGVLARSKHILEERTIFRRPRTIETFPLTQWRQGATKSAVYEETHSFANYFLIAGALYLAHENWESIKLWVNSYFSKDIVESPGLERVMKRADDVVSRMIEGDYISFIEEHPEINRIMGAPLIFDDETATMTIWNSSMYFRLPLIGQREKGIVFIEMRLNHFDAWALQSCRVEVPAFQDYIELDVPQKLRVYDHRGVTIRIMKNPLEQLPPYAQLALLAEFEDKPQYLKEWENYKKELLHSGRLEEVKRQSRRETKEFNKIV